MQPDPQEEIAGLKARLAAAEETLNAIYNQKVDALIVGGPEGDQVFTLQGAERSYRLLVEAMNEGALTLIPDGTILFCNSRFAEMARCPMEQVTGSTWHRFFSPDEQVRIKALLARAGGGGKKDEFSLQTDDGYRLPVQLSARSMLLEGMEAFAVLVTDVSELKSAHKSLRLVNEQLEARVRERTLELAKANEVLRGVIAGRERLEESLRASEKEFRAIFESSAAGKVQVDPETGTFLRVNRKMCEITGFAAEELIGRRVTDITHPEDRERDATGMKELLAGELQEYVVENRYYHKQGHVVWAQVAATAFRDGDGKALRINAVIQDITSRKRMEEALRQSERLYRAIGESIDFGIWTSDAAGRNTYFSPAFLKLIGLSQEQCSGPDLQRVMHPDDVEDTLAAWSECVRTGSAWEYEHRFLGVDGLVHHTLARGVPIRDDNGKINSWAGINLDIRTLKETERALRESEERYSLALASAKLGTWDWDVVSGMVIWSAHHEALLGYPPGTPHRKVQDLLDRVHPDDQPLVTEKFRADGSTAAEFEAEFRVVWPDRSVHWLNSRGRFSFNEDNEPVRMRGVLWDITERKTVEMALKEAQGKLHEHAAQLERRVQERTTRLQQTIEELEAFSYSVSHDLRAPLRSIQSFSQILVEECGAALSPEGRDYLRRVVSSADRLDKLILDVLAYSRTARADVALTPVNLDEVTRDVIRQYPMFQKEGVEIGIEGKLPRVLGHEASLTQCISNLLGNAVKFVAPGTNPRIKIWTEEAGTEVRVWFEDNGIGISQRDQERIFKIFERVHAGEKFPGTGIGLSIVKKAIERMGGTSGVESELGRGSRFWIQLPMATNL
ncbi:MAG: domain S-box protein [Pedosphaera sp.]|nr:domain S-box protein [Pedosphaera sp.]